MKNRHVPDLIRDLIARHEAPDQVRGATAVSRRQEAQP